MGQAGQGQGQAGPQGPQDPKAAPSTGSTANGGGGMRQGVTPPGGPAAEPYKPETPAPSSDEAPSSSISPDVPQPDLVLKNLKTILQDEQKTRDLLQETGMSRDELDQFVRKFEKAPEAAPAREAGELPDQQEPERKFDQNRRLSGGLPSSTVSSRSERGPNSTPQDAAGGNTEGLRTVVPPELSSRFQAYQSSLSGARPGAAPRSSPTTSNPQR